MVVLDLGALRREYGAGVLDEKDMASSPIEQTERWLKAAIETESHDPTAMVLSTVDETQHPDGRVVLLKAITEAGFVFYTHYDSAKGKQLKHHPYAALTAYWPVLSRQLRIKGKISQLSEADSDAYFASRPYLSQVGACAMPQSQVIPDRETLEQAVDQYVKAHPEAPLKRPAHWGGYVLKPECVEFWQGRDNRLHDRVLYLLEDRAWKRCRLSP